MWCGRVASLWFQFSICAGEHSRRATAHGRIPLNLAKADNMFGEYSIWQAGLAVTGLQMFVLLRLFQLLCRSTNSHARTRCRAQQRMDAVYKVAAQQAFNPGALVVYTVSRLLVSSLRLACADCSGPGRQQHAFSSNCNRRRLYWWRCQTR